MFADHLFQDVPHLRSLAFHQALGRLDGRGLAPQLQLREDEGLNSSSAIFFGSPHWCRRSVGPTTITERPSSRRACRAGSGEPALLALDHVARDFSGRLLVPVMARPGGVVQERVHGFLQHALFVAHDDVRRIELEQRRRRLLRLMTRRYRSFRSEVAKRPVERHSGAGREAAPAAR